MCSRACGFPKLCPAMPARASRPSKMDRWAPIVDQWLEDDRR